MKKLFVGGISWNTTEDGLRQAFEPFGEVAEATIVMDRQTGRSRGFGFVTFNDDANADRARQELDGTQLDGRTIKVDEARDRAPRGPGGGGFRGGRGGEDRGGYRGGDDRGGGHRGDRNRDDRW
jgi:RNA recognition motif-containing protein